MKIELSTMELILLCNALGCQANLPGYNPVRGEPEESSFRALQLALLDKIQKAGIPDRPIYVSQILSKKGVLPPAPATLAVADAAQPASQG